MGPDEEATGLYGVATPVYGGTFSKIEKFVSLEAAKSYAASFVAPVAVICGFSDGRWRAL